MSRLALVFLVLAAAAGLLAFDLLGDVGWDAGTWVFGLLLALAAGCVAAGTVGRGAESQF